MTIGAAPIAALLALACLALAVAFPVPATAAVHSGQVADPAGDGPEPARDLVSAAVSYEPAAGALTFRLELAGPPPPSEDAQILGALGRLEEGVCVAPTMILATLLPGDTTVWLRDDDGAVPAESSGDAQREVAGSRVTLSATDPALRGQAAECALAIISDAATATVNWDETEVFRVNEVKAAKLKATVRGPAKLRRGAAAKVEVRVSNPGNAAARGVRLRIGLKGRASLRPKAKALGTIGPGKARTVKATVRAAGRAKGTIRLTARATAKNAKAASAADRIAVRVPRPRRPPPATGGGPAGRLFWGFEPYQYDRSAGVIGLYFANRRFVHLGMPEGGLPRCGRVTAKRKDGETTPGCLRYSYDRRTGRVRIGKSKGTYRNGKLKLQMKESAWQIAGKSWYGSSLPGRGSRFGVQLRSAGYYGLCGVTPYCSTWQENLTLTRDGRFGRQRSSLTTSGGGALPFVAIGKLGPDERGRYKVLSRSRIRFRYASGKTEVQTIAVQLDRRGRPDAAREGLLLDDDWFYRD